MDEFVGNSAVELYQVRLNYGFGRAKTEVLKGISLNVATGSIYGLLGPSGCGKTTLLRCVVGRLRPKKGFVQVFGKTPGRPNCNIPGSGVGYMPQEIALFQELTIGEVFSYFGRLHHMSSLNVRSRTEFLLDFLNLPNEKRLIKNLSGGQQRRVSFAIALLHEPPLLILDEPTVGVDPVLRLSIWNHLLEICVNGSVTVIITTHYIEEARQANRVGLMRNGKLLAEDEPGALITKYSLQSLEDVFLQLCQQESTPGLEKVEFNHQNHKASITCSNSSFNNLYERKLPLNEKVRWQDYCVPPSLGRINALAIKNFIKMWRTLILLIFQFLNPAIQIILFCLAVGGDPRNLEIVIFNEDKGQFSNQFLRHLSNESLHQVHVNSTEEALDRVVNNDAWAMIHMWDNFSTALIQRFLSKNVSDNVITSGSVHVRQDSSDQQITFFIQRAIFNAYSKFSEEALINAGQNPRLASNPIEFGPPLYGTLKPSFTEYMAPGLILSIAYFMAVGLTALAFVVDKKEGLLDRSYVSGVTSFEIMCGHIVTQLCVMIVQVGLVLILAIEGFGVSNRGSIWWVILLTLLQGMCGMTYGFFISTVCNDEGSAIMLALGSFYPCLLLSGTLWPTQSMPHFLRVISQALPQTIPISSMRWILTRGRGITWSPVSTGFLVTIAWIVAFIVLSTIAIRLKR